MSHQVTGRLHGEIPAEIQRNSLLLLGGGGGHEDVIVRGNAHDGGDKSDTMVVDSSAS
jgi:hypothetical protein